jgi:hypothetical protein
LICLNAGLWRHRYGSPDIGQITVGQEMSVSAVAWSYRSEIELRISKYRSLLRRVATPQAVQHVNKIIAELERELLKIDE